MTPIPWILQRYIFREMGKTFVLTGVGLTGVLGLGGGVLNMMELGEVSPGQFARLMLIILPLSAAMTMPLAALFAAASTYGRLSADNEFVACRSSGINIHVLFAPALVLSVFAAIVTFVFFSFIIPGMVMNLDKLLSADLQSLIEQRINRPKGMSLGGRIRIFADESTVNASNPNVIELNRVVFVEVDRDHWQRFGTVRQVQFKFDTSGPKPAFSGDLVGLSYYDPESGQLSSLGHQHIASNILPETFLAKLKFLTLAELLHYWKNPAEWREAAYELLELRLAAGRLKVYDTIFSEYQDNGAVILADDNVRYTIHAEQCGQTPREGAVEFTGVTIEEVKSDRTRAITAKRAVLDVTFADSLERGTIRIDLYDARLSDGSTVVEKTKERLSPVAVKPGVLADFEAMPDDELLESRTSGPGPDRLAQRRAAVIETRDGIVRKIAAIVSERVAFSISVCALVLLGAALGIIFRGAHVLMAFGISFLPLLVVMITIVMGKQLAQNPGTGFLGLALMWSGIAVVAFLDLWTLTRVLRR